MDDQQAQDQPAEAAAEKTRKVRRQRDVLVTDPATDTSTLTAVILDEDATDLPQTATLAAPYGFYDDDGSYLSWAAGQVLTDAAEIAMLIERGAVFTAA